MSDPLVHSEEPMSSPASTATVIKFAISDLGSKNGHHAFEQLCTHLARARIASNVLPATGPVSAGGDQGRDFETFAVSSERRSAPPAAASPDRIVFACTIQRRGVARKIRADVDKICRSGERPDQVVIFVGSDIEVAVRHKLQAWARTEHAVALEIFDAEAITALLCENDLFWIAEEFLHVPVQLGPRRLGQLSDLLSAQAEAASRTPHGHWGLTTPRLLDVYIDRRVQSRTKAGEVVSVRDDRLTDLVSTRSGHLLLIGAPGTGKTTLVQQLVTKLAAGWSPGAPLPESIPLRILARDLVGGEASFSECVRYAVYRTARTQGPLDPDLFAQGQGGRDWLVIVDGIDEISDYADRAAVISLIAQRARQHHGHRFIVVTRPLSTDELQPLSDAGFHEARLPGFTVEDLGDFSMRWFQASKSADPQGLAAAFMEAALQDAHLLEVLQVPLFATVAVAAFADDPASRLPNNRLDLINRFMQGIDERSRPRRDPSVEVIARDQLDELIGELAEQTVAGTGDLAATLREWMQTNDLVRNS
ncbi:NACHT domain-containing protein [Catellatospora sp. NPDC049609]|uniref:NACHT domain-containing protein n=1 Tax=Catellatospora sp. NPDC049609 TaxID=3155505 RepID=UPI00344630F9